MDSLSGLFVEPVDLPTRLVGGGRNPAPALRQKRSQLRRDDINDPHLAVDGTTSQRGRQRHANIRLADFEGDHQRVATQPHLATHCARAG